MTSIALRLRSQTAVMSSSTSGMKPHCSGWCGSKQNTGGAPMTSPGAAHPGRLGVDAGPQGDRVRGRVVGVVRVAGRAWVSTTAGWTSR